MELRCKLNRFKFADNQIQMYYVNSSHVYAIGYDEENELLYIEFEDGSLYEYENVDEGMWRDLQLVNSKGSWVHWYLVINDGTYPYSEVTGDYEIEYVGPALNQGEPHPEGYITGY